MSSAESPPERCTNLNMKFTKEIECMMHAFGDNPKPLLSSVNLVETVVNQQMHSLLYQAEEVAAMHGSKAIGIKDLLFLMRKDRIKISRLLGYLAVREMKCSLNYTVGANREIKDVPGKLRQQCLKFLKLIDQTGELTDKHCQPFDWVKHERNVRAELMSQNLDEKGYIEYANARRISFMSKFMHGKVKMREWLLSQCDNLTELPKNNTLEFEIICYLAYETVAQIVDLALLVRQDGAARPGDAFSYYEAGFTRRAGFYPPPCATQSSGTKIGNAPPLTPAEIKEALRRYWSTQVGPFTSSTMPGAHFKLLAC